MLAKIRGLAEALDENGIHYCHWKSNFSLPEAVWGRTDLDLLVRRQDAPAFREILSRQGFRPASDTDGRPFPAMEHYYALDEESGDLVHLHAYYRVITGESLAKNYRLPIEEMLLQHTREAGLLRVPTKGAELVPFTLRMLLKHTSWMELVLLSRYWEKVQDEMNWLAEGDTLDTALALAGRWLPPLDPGFFGGCVAALQAPASLWTRIVVGHRLRRRLRVYARHSVPGAWLSSARRFGAMLTRRLGGSKKNMNLQSGGAVIALVGPEATGKSTLLAELSRWLGAHFAVEQKHAGKPTPTWLSAIPNAGLPLLRSVLPSYRSTRVEIQTASGNPTGNPKPFPLIYGVRSVLLGYDRRALLRRAFRQAANGTIVLCDRYPSLQCGAPDSPQLSHLPLPGGRASARRLLARLEARLYREIPPPDLVIYLNAPLEVTVLRNVNREKTEPEDHVRRRHAQSASLDFGEAPVHRVDTNRPFADTVREVKGILWDFL